MPRFHFALQDVTQLHADIGWFIGALAVALAIGLHFTGAPARAARASCIVLAGLAVHWAIGYTQYFSHLPAGLVWLHVAMPAVLWILVLRLYLSTRERQPLTAAPDTQAGPGTRGKESASSRRNPGSGSGGPLTTLKQAPPSTFFFFCAGVMALPIRIQLMSPDSNFLSDQQYNELFTMHGAIMLLFATPLFAGFANFLARHQRRPVDHGPGGRRPGISGLSAQGDDLQRKHLRSPRKTLRVPVGGYVWVLRGAGRVPRWRRPPRRSPGASRGTP